MKNIKKKKLTYFSLKIVIILILSIVISYGITNKKDDIWKVRINSIPNTILIYNLDMSDVLLKKLLVKPETSKDTYRVVASNLKPIELKVINEIQHLVKLELNENLIFMEFKNKEITDDSVSEVINLINQEIKKYIRNSIDRYYLLATEKKINFNQMKISKLTALLNTYKNEKGIIEYDKLKTGDVDKIAGTILNSVEGKNKSDLIDNNYSEFFLDFSNKYSILLGSHRPNIKIAIQQLESYDPEKDDFIILELQRLMQKTNNEKFFVNYGIDKKLHNKPSLYMSTFGIFLLLIIINFLFIFLYRKSSPKHLKGKISSLLDLT